MKNLASKEFKLKWENYWYYHKIHTFVAIFILLALIYTVTQCTAKVEKPDATIVIATQSFPMIIDQATDISIEKDIAQYITDFNKDGKKNVNLSTYDFSSNNSILSAVQDKFSQEFFSANSFIFIVDDAVYKAYSQQDTFSKIKDIIPNAPTVDDYRIPISSLAIFKSNSSYSYLKNYYFVIRRFKGTVVDNSANIPAYQNAVNILKRIVANSKTT